MMLEQNGGQGAPGADAGYANLKEHLRKKTADEIRLELDELVREEEKAGTEVDPRRLMTYFEVLEEIDPLPPDSGNFEQSWDIFTRNHPEFIPTEAPRERRRPRNIKLGRLIEVTVLALVILIVTAAAFHWPDYIVNWGRQTLSIGPSESGIMELDIPGKSGYSSLQEAVDQFDLMGVAPTWIPSDFTIEDVFVQDLESYVKITAVYRHGSADANFSIRIMVYNDSSEVPRMIAEDEESTRVVYAVAGIDHIISNNYSRLQATWESGKCLCEISGDISETEIKQMVSSIYER